MVRKRVALLGARFSGTPCMGRHVPDKRSRSVFSDQVPDVRVVEGRARGLGYFGRESASWKECIISV